MPSTKHEDVLLRTLEKYKNQGFKVIRLDKRAIPDAILFKDDLVFALEVETGSYEDSHKSSFHRTKDWSDFDEVWIVIKKPRGHTIEEYEEALELYKNGSNAFKISKRMNIPYSIIYNWIHGRSRPITVKHKDYHSNKEVIIYDV